MSNDFFKTIKKKMEVSSPKEMDQEFWRRFEVENPTSQQTSPWFSFTQLASLCSIIFIGLIFVKMIPMDQQKLSSDVSNAIIYEQDLLENMEILEFMAENDLSLEEMERLMEQDES